MSTPQLKSLPQLQTEIGEWSRKNFGTQQSKTKQVSWIDKTHNVAKRGPLVLGSLAPLLGMVEELGELNHAFQCRNKADQIDACADIGIYALDYLYRDRNMLSVNLDLSQHYHTLDYAGLGRDLDKIVTRILLTEASVRLGTICHATLKHHQGIRGMDDPTAYTREVQMGTIKLLAVIDQYLSCIHSTSLVAAINQTWEIVSKRNWVENPTDGGNHHHAPSPVTEGTVSK